MNGSGGGSSMSCAFRSVSESPVAEAASVGGPSSVMNGRGGGRSGGSSRSCAGGPSGVGGPSGRGGGSGGRFSLFCVVGCVVLSPSAEAGSVGGPSNAVVGRVGGSFRTVAGSGGGSPHSVTTMIFPVEMHKVAEIVSAINTVCICKRLHKHCLHLATLINHRVFFQYIRKEPTTRT